MLGTCEPLLCTPIVRYGLAYIVFREFRCYQKEAAPFPILAGTRLLKFIDPGTTEAHDVRDVPSPLRPIWDGWPRAGDERECSGASPGGYGGKGGAPPFPPALLACL